MKKILLFSLLMLVFSCTEYIERPKNLVDEDTMSSILADFAMTEQVTFSYPAANLESGTQQILKSYQVQSKDFVESYQYYVVKRKMKNITEVAQKKLLEKDPKAEQYIKDRQRGTPEGAPPLFK